jgi:hypothetical protein
MCSFAGYPAYPPISVQDQLARSESIFFKVFQLGGQNDPSILSGAPQLPP